MNDAVRNLPEVPVTAETQPKPGKSATMSRIKLALLEQYANAHEQAGGDPYNAGTGKSKPDHWRGNARRI